MEPDRPLRTRPTIGVGVIVIKSGKVLLGKRKGSHGEGSWSFPGGHLEFGEAIETCARREMLEETGVRIRNIRHAAFTNDVFENENRHYVTLYVVAEHESGEAIVKEPNKCDEWKWCEWGKLPQPLFLPIRNLLQQNYDPFRD